MLLVMGVKQAQLVLGLLKDGSLSIKELPAASQDLDHQVRETSFLAKNQATLLSLGGYLQGRQAYCFGHSVTHVSREAAGQAQAEETLLPLWRLHSHQPQQNHHLIPASGSCHSSHGAPTCCSSSFTSRELLAALSLSGIAEAIAAEMQVAPWF